MLLHTPSEVADLLSLCCLRFMMASHRTLHWTYGVLALGQAAAVRRVACSLATLPVATILTALWTYLRSALQRMLVARKGPESSPVLPYLDATIAS